jgi:hypothetical protein
VDAAAQELLLWTLEPDDLEFDKLQPLEPASPVPDRTPKEFLCMFVFSGTTVGAVENLGYFLTFGIDPNR